MQSSNNNNDWSSHALTPQVNEWFKQLNMKYESSSWSVILPAGKGGIKMTYQYKCLTGHTGLAHVRTNSFQNLWSTFTVQSAELLLTLKFPLLLFSTTLSPSPLKASILVSRNRVTVTAYRLPALCWKKKQKNFIRSNTSYVNLLAHFKVSISGSNVQDCAAIGCEFIDSSPRLQKHPCYIHRTILNSQMQRCHCPKIEVKLREQSTELSSPMKPKKRANWQINSYLVRRKSDSVLTPRN